MKVLVLCVDRDDDLGRKTKIKGPVIGREKNIEAGKALIMADPGESDANTIFEAVRIFDELKKEAVEIVTLTGHSSRGYKADKNVSQQLDTVFHKYKDVDGVYLVTDGADDDEIIPVIQSRKKIVSKKTLIIKQAKELEQSYYVLKEVLKDPHFARLIFGLPGLVLLTVAFLQELGFKIIVFLIGFYLIMKGFGIEEPILNAFRGFRETTSVERASFPLYMGSLLIFVLAVWAGMDKVAVSNIVEPIKQVAVFLNGFIALFTIGLIFFLVGRMGDMHYTGEPLKVRRYAMTIVTSLTMLFVIMGAIDLIVGQILATDFLAYILVAFFGAIIGLSFVRAVWFRRYISARLKRELEVFDQAGNKLGVLSEINKVKKSIVVSGKEKLVVPFSRILMVKDFVVVKIST
jgi:putative membrane protein